MNWAETRELLILRARATRKLLVNADDFDQLRPEIQYNYVLDEAKRWFMQKMQEMLQ